MRSALRHPTRRKQPGAQVTTGALCQEGGRARRDRLTSDREIGQGCGMRGFAVVVLLGLGACAAATGTTASASSEMRDWQTPTGKPPTKAEFSALVAACQDKAKATTESGPMDGCLADLGLRRAQ
jgi:hypothetical protein